MVLNVAQPSWMTEDLVLLEEQPSYSAVVAPLVAVIPLT
jgi:hypothetical protein